jgi:RND family efflux transporter MFP subunit
MTKSRLMNLALALAVAACSEAAPQAPELRPVRTIAADPRPLDDERRAIGEIRPRHESDFGFRVSGKVVARAVDVGATARRGDLLARLDDQDYRNKLRSAEADLAAAEAALIEAQSAEARSRQLLSSGVTTRALYDAALKNLRSAEAKVEAARAALDLARDQLGYAELRADFDGIVTAVGAEPGQVVNVGQMIVRLARPGEKDAVFAIAEAAFGQRPAGEAPPEIAVTLLSNPAVSAAGIVREIAPVADPATRTFQVKVTLSDPPAEMRFGASVVGRLKSASAPVVVLPSGALFDRGGQPAVWVVDAARRSVTLRPVVIVRYETDRVVVGEGLARGDIVVTAGVNRLREGQSVRLAEGAAP